MRATPLMRMGESQERKRAKARIKPEEGYVTTDDKFFRSYGEAISHQMGLDREEGKGIS